MRELELDVHGVVVNAYSKRANDIARSISHSHASLEVFSTAHCDTVLYFIDLPDSVTQRNRLFQQLYCVKCIFIKNLPRYHETRTYVDYSTDSRRRVGGRW